jgi:hypothetical protein
MTLKPDTLQIDGTSVPPTPSSTPPPATPPGTPPGQQTGDKGSGTSGQTPPSTTGTAPGQQSGSGGGSRDTLTETLTKADLDARIEKAKRSGTREVLKALGFTNLDSLDDLTQAQSELADLLTFAREAKAAQMTADEKVQQHMTDLTKRAETAEKKLADEQKARRDADDRYTTYVRGQAIINAAQAARHPEDVVGWAEKNQPDAFKTVLTADGSVDGPVVAAIVKACREDRKDWFETDPGSPSNAEAGYPGAALAQAKPAQQQAAEQTARM